MHRVDDGSALTVSFNTKTSVKPNLKTLKSLNWSFSHSRGFTVHIFGLTRENCISGLAVVKTCGFFDQMCYISPNLQVTLIKSSPKRFHIRTDSG